MKILLKIEEFVFKSNIYKFIGISIALMLFKSGLYFIPSLHNSFLLSQNPFINPFDNPNNHYLMWTWLAPFLAWFLSINSFFYFYIFHLLFSIFFIFLFFRIIFKRLGDFDGRKAVVIFLSLPVSWTSFYWSGTDSIILFLLLMIFYFPLNPFFIFLIGFFIGLQHFEIGIFASISLIISIYLAKRTINFFEYKLNLGLYLLGGIILGKILLILIFNSNNIEVNSGRFYYLINNTHFRGLEDLFLYFHPIIWSVLGPGWLVFFKYLELRKESIPFSIVFISLIILLTPLILDQTRVLAVVTFPIIFIFWLSNKNFLKIINKREISILFLLTILIPMGWVWQGKPKWSLFPYDLAIILNKFIDFISLQANPMT